MEKYHKIETLFKFDNVSKKFKFGHFQNNNVELLLDNLWVFTEKVDGTNFRLNWDGYDMSYAGRKDTSEFSAEQKKWIESNIATPEMEHLLEQIFKDNEITIFGELYGKNIQKEGKLYSEDYQFKVFDIKLPITDKPITRKYVSREIVEKICESLGFDVVPVVFQGTITEAIDYVKTHEISTFSRAKLEGLVGVPRGNFLDENGKRIIVKIKRKDLGK